MKKITGFIFLFISTIAFAQNVGIGTTNPHASAQLDVSSTSKGFLPPRMTTAQRDAIANPTPGLMFFNTTTQSLEIFTVYGWYGIQVAIPPRKLMGGTGLDQAYDIQQTADGGFIVAGYSNSSASGDVTDSLHGVALGTKDYWIIKLDASCNITWNKLLGGDNEEIVTSIRQTTDGGYIVAGYSRSSANGDVSGTNNGGEDYWIVKLDDLGRIIWERLIGGSGNDKATSIRQTTDGGYIVAGYSFSSASGNVTEINHGITDFWIVKLDASGNISWNRLLGGNNIEETHEIIQAGDGTYVIAGVSMSSANGNVSTVNHGGNDFWIVRLSSAGTILWNKLLGGNGDEAAQSIQQVNTDQYILAGYSTSSANGDVTGTNHGGIFSMDYWIVKLDRFGNILWNKLLGGNGNEDATSIKPTSDGGYIVAGTSSASSANGDVTGISRGSHDYWIVKLDGTGNIIWNRLIGGNAAEFATSVVQTVDGGFIIAGYSSSSYNGDVTAGNHGAGNDTWIIKLGNTGFLY